MSASKRIDEIASRRGFVPGTFLTQDEYDALVAKAAAQHKANEDNAPEQMTSDDEDDGDGGDPSRIAKAGGKIILIHTEMTNEHQSTNFSRRRKRTFARGTISGVGWRGPEM